MRCPQPPTHTVHPSRINQAQSGAVPINAHPASSAGPRRFGAFGAIIFALARNWSRIFPRSQKALTAAPPPPIGFSSAAINMFQKQRSAMDTQAPGCGPALACRDMPGRAAALPCTLLLPCDAPLSSPDFCSDLSMTALIPPSHRGIRVSRRSCVSPAALPPPPPVALPCLYYPENIPLYT